MGPDAQKEIRDVAGRVSEIAREKFPVSWSALHLEPTLEIPHTGA